MKYKKNVMKKILSLLALAVLGFVLFYINLPVINYGFTGFAFILLVLVIVAIVFSTGITVSEKTKQIKLAALPNKFLYVIVAVILAYCIILPIVTSTKMLRTDSYQKLIGEVKNGQKITNHIAPISIDKIRVVDEKLAYLLGEKIIGSQPALGSQVELGNFCIQKVGNELYWVAPLLHSGLLKWFNNQDGTDGYVMVSATNERDVRLVQHVGGKAIKIIEVSI